MRAKLPPAQLERPNELPPPPFSGFLDLLKRRGFAVGVDRHLRLVSLLERIGGECRPEQLKQHIAPLFATNEKEQARFYRVFDEYFSLLRPAKKTGPTEPVPPTETGKSIRWRRVLIWGSLTVVAAVILIFWGRFSYAPWHFQPKKPTPIPKPSETVFPRSMASARPSASKPSLAASPTAPPLVQPEAEQNTVMPLLARNRIALLWTGGLLPLALFAADELRRFRKRRQLVLERTRARKPPFTWPIHIEPRPLGYLRSEQFYKVARKLRRRQIAEYRRLDVARTIDATIAASGYPTFQYRPDSRMPEYLILIDRTSSRDHQAALFDQLAQALQREGIFVTRYFFDGDPRVCWSERATASVSLSDLQKIFPEHRLIIFGRGDRLIDPVTGELTEWSAMFQDWHDRAVVTPAAPSGWNRREQTLTEQFLVFPGTLEGIEQLAERFDSSVPAELEVSDADDPLPHDFERDNDLGKLRSYLGEPVFQWLCACATYPELHWDLTLLLGSLPALGERLVTERNLLRLVRIPWFRAGAIPDERRLQLLAALDPAKEVAVRAAIVRTLEKSPAPEASFAAENRRLEIVLQECLLGRRSTSELKSALRSLPLDELTRDYVLLHETRRISRLAFALPERARLLLFDKGVPALGLNLGTRLGLTSAVIAAALLAIALLVPPENTTGKPIGEPMRQSAQTNAAPVPPAEQVPARAETYTSAIPSPSSLPPSPAISPGQDQLANQSRQNATTPTEQKKPPRKKSELDSALDQVSDESVAAAMKEFQDLLAQAKGDTSELIRQNANELEQRLVLLKERKIDEKDFDFFVNNQKRDLRVFIDSQPAQAQERAEKLTLHLLDIAATKVVPVLISAPDASLPPSPAISPGRNEIANQSAQTNAAPVQSVEQMPAQAQTNVTIVPGAGPGEGQGGIDIESAETVPPRARGALSQALAAEGFAPRNWDVGKGPEDRVTVQHYFPEDGVKAERVQKALGRIMGKVRVAILPRRDPPKDYRPGHVDIWLPDPALKLLLYKKPTPRPLPRPRSGATPSRPSKSKK